ncbi:hypothetical protein EHV15_17990 [Paenibacillus oralis]|uniref:Uncharacterized protein n=1 Tax=Paenibacillus oralis TaxID=2490856 RepID=A0A3P3U3A7_9BACL|nr:hypothetical protein [Paenibacillus oralis]RRJ64604.1 hypothetical protein EHV15_17990 [Paenibacillus oralis]
MKFNEKTRIGILYQNEPSRAVIVRRVPALQGAAPEIASIIKSFTIEQYFQMAKDQVTPGWLSETLAELADVPYVAEPEEPEKLPSFDYADGTPYIPVGTTCYA